VVLAVRVGPERLARPECPGLPGDLQVLVGRDRPWDRARDHTLPTIVKQKSQAPQNSSSRVSLQVLGRLSNPRTKSKSRRRIHDASGRTRRAMLPFVSSRRGQRPCIAAPRPAPCSRASWCGCRAAHMPLVAPRRSRARDRPAAQAFAAPPATTPAHPSADARHRAPAVWRGLLPGLARSVRAQRPAPGRSHSRERRRQGETSTRTRALRLSLQDAAAAAGGTAACTPARAACSAASLVWSSDVLSTVPPSPFRPSSTLSAVTLRTSTNRAAVPG